ncbi:MAG: anti sigma factor C-terminal domain-containing protein [Clostridium sp.]|uniref:anti sigma factor C-terminal domain-containing protein n=1 Tax=Clostridium sp. TaxID=1506 RepID=UPI0025C691D6|nr:anti sigma factor C-terminal domain-containing protein [Clostridium sp.]MCF0148589.1 anti sigma factor C-terminal domain-containing protein [Clostridium sp.]
MSFKFIFEKYKSGTATEEEIKIVEDEIEKNELINEYLSENIFEEIGKVDVTEDDTILIKKAVNRRLRKINILAVLSVILVFCIINYLILPAYNSLFYDPSGKIRNEFNQNQLFIDMRAFTELHLAGYTTDEAEVEALGLGKYDIRVNQNNKFTQENTIFNGKVVRNKLKTQNNNLYKFPAVNVFYYRDNKSAMYLQEDGSYTYGQSKEERDLLINIVKELPKGSVISSYISFNKDLSLDNLNKLQEKYRFRARWVAVRTNEIYSGTKIGFDPIGIGGVLAEGTLSDDVYPYFELSNVNDSIKDSEYVLETHFKTLLKYMSSRQTFIETFFNVNGMSSIMYSEALKYIEDNGVKLYGMLVYSDVETFLNLVQDENIYTISIDNAKFSVFQR